MSYPLSACMIAKAAHGDADAYAELKRRTNYNRRYGVYSIFPCDHEPRHHATEEEVAALYERMNGELDAEQREHERLHPPRAPGNFDKWIFPVIKGGIPSSLPDLKEILVQNAAETPKTDRP